MTQIPISGAIVQGIKPFIRGEQFKQFIVNTLTVNQTRNLKPEDLILLTNPQSIKMYDTAFTSPLVNTRNNYESLEQLGDATCNKFATDYIHNRFPQLNEPWGKGIAATVINNLISKKSFANFAEKLGFIPYIWTTLADISTEEARISVLEDCLEAFVGATELIYDTHYSVGYSYNIIYNFFKPNFDNIHISLKHEDVTDPISRLNEIFVPRKSQGIRLKKEFNNPNPKNTRNIRGVVLKPITVNLYVELYAGAKFPLVGQLIPGVGMLIGSGSDIYEKKAEQQATLTALEMLKENGIAPKIPYVYTMIDENAEIKEIEEPKITREYIKENWEGKFLPSVEDEKESINSQYSTKHINGLLQYTSTLLALYCRTRNKSGIKTCLKFGADPTILDSDGSSVLDLLFMGPVDEEFCENEMRRLIKSVKNIEKRLTIQQPVYDFFYKQYDNKYFLKHLKDFDVIEYPSSDLE